MKRKLISSVLAMTMLIPGIAGISPVSAAGEDVSSVIARAEEYLKVKAYYTDSSAGALDQALADLRDYSELGDQQLIDIALADVETAIENLEPEYTRYTLSGNKWNESDRTNFYGVWEPGFELITLDENTPSYKYVREDSIESQSNEKNGDPTCVKLTQGNIMSGMNVWTKWDQGHPIEVDFDLGGIYAVDRVDFIQDIESANNSMKTLEVYVSQDGKEYVKAGEAAGENDLKLQGNTGHEHTLTSVEMPVKKTRYVRVVASRLSHQLRVSQVAVFGYKNILGRIDDAAAEAQDYINAAEYYTGDSMSVLQAAVDAAANISEENSAEEIEAAASAIENAIAGLETVNQRLVLSGNTWTDSDRNYYSALTPPVSLENGPNKPSYTWAEGTSADCISQDPNLVKMNGGSAGNLDISKCGVGTKWDDAAPGITLWNLGVTGVIDRVDVFSGHEEYKQLGTVTVSVSEDGVSFTDVKTQKAAGEYIGGGAQAMYQTIVTFAPVKARFVRVTCKKAVSADVHMTNINEIVIFGIGSDYSDVEADFTKLEEEIAKYGAETMSVLKQFATEESYSALLSAVEAGRTMIEEQSASQFEADAALADIKAKFEEIVYTETEGILTNNLVSDFDKSLYSGLDNIDIGMTYKLVSDDENSDMLKQDTSFTNLIRGNISATPGGESVFGRWDGDTNVSVILDAAEEVYFTGADLYEWVNRNDGRGVDSIKISVSSDGEIYTEIASIASDYTVGTDGLFQHENGNIVINKIGADIVPVKGRYIKIDSKRRKNQQVLAEVVVKGFRVPHVLENPLVFGQTDYVIMDADGGDLTQLEGANFILASGELINESETDASVKVITAVYNADHRLLAISVSSDVVIKAGGSSSWENLLEGLGGLPQGSSLVNFAWTSDGSMIPMAKASVK